MYPNLLINLAAQIKPCKLSSFLLQAVLLRKSAFSNLEKKYFYNRFFNVRISLDACHTLTVVVLKLFVNYSCSQGKEIRYIGTSNKNM